MRLQAIDGLRGLAFLAVVYQHAYAANISAWFLRHNIRPFILADGWAGVTLFFVLSGFVLSLPFIGKEATKLDADGIKHFLLRRARRLLPLFWFVSFIGFAVFLPANNLTPLLLTISTIQMFVPSQFYPLVNGAFWSLSIEIWASAVLPFLILLAARFGYVRILMTVALIALLVRLFACLFNDPVSLTIRSSVPGRLDDFAAGMVLAWLFANGRLKDTRHWMAFCGLAALAAGCIMFDLPRYGPLYWSISLRAFSNIGFTIGFSLLVAYGLSENSWFRRPLNIWPLQILGLMCFSLYSWHLILISVMRNIDTISGQLGFWITLIVISAFTYRFIEFPKSDVKKLFKFGS